MEISHRHAKDTWFQGYSYKEQEWIKTVFNRKTAETRESTDVSFAKVGSDFFSSDKQLIGGVTLRNLFPRNQHEYALFHDHKTKDCKIENMQAHLYVQKMTVIDSVYSAIETKLTKPLLFNIILRSSPKLF